MIATTSLGEGADCYEYVLMDNDLQDTQYFYTERSLCVDPSALRLTVDTLPVPLKNIFPKPGPNSDKQKWNVKLDQSMGGADTTPKTSIDADKNAFSSYIVSGPSNELTSLNKRDGSRWELFDCEDAAKENRRHTVRAVCTTDGLENSHFKDIHLGTGVAETVVEMPSSCGPGK